MKKICFSAMMILAILALFAINVQAATIGDLQTKLAGEGNDITFEEEILVGEGQDVELDLKGKTLSLSKIITISNGGKLTVTGNGTVKSTAGQNIFSVTTGGNLVIENGTFENYVAGKRIVGIYGTVADEGIKTTLEMKKDATFISDCPISVGINGTSKASYGVEVDVYGKISAITENGATNGGSIGVNVYGKIKETTGNVPVINIHEGTVIETKEGSTGNANSDASVGVYIAGFAKVNISGGEITGTDGICMKSGILNITGGTIHGTGDYVNPAVAWSNGSETTGSGISISSHSSYAGNMDVTISNATIKSDKGYAIVETLTSSPTTLVKNLKISSADVSSPKGVIYTESNLVYLQDGSVQKKIGETYVIGTEYAINLPENIEGGSITSSVSKALPGEKVTLKVNANSGYQLQSLKVLDAQEKEVTISNNEFVMPDDSVTVKATFKKTEVKTELPQIDETKDVNLVIDNYQEVEDVLLETLKSDETFKKILETTNLSVNLEIKDIEPSKELEEKAKQLLEAESADIKISKFFDITVYVKDEQGNELGTLSELTKKVKLTVLIPDEIPEVEEGYVRKYYMVKEHGNNVSLIEAKISEDGTSLDFNSDEFSAYAIAYKDEPVIVAALEGATAEPAQAQDTTNPKTGDKIMTYVTLLIIATIGIAVTIIKMKKANNCK